MCLGQLRSTLMVLLVCQRKEMRTYAQKNSHAWEIIGVSGFTQVETQKQRKGWFLPISVICRSKESPLNMV